MNTPPEHTVRIADPPPENQRFMRSVPRSGTPLHELPELEIVEMGERHSVVTMPVRPQAFSSTGNPHGGAIATLIDVAAGTAAARGSGLEPAEQRLVTVDLQVRYLGRPHGDVWSTPAPGCSRPAAG